MRRRPLAASVFRSTGRGLALRLLVPLAGMAALAPLHAQEESAAPTGGDAPVIAPMPEIDIPWPDLDGQ
ncbi:MAG TPA: hypothetical protein VFF89_06195, partial [Sphingobium sp.]|nr:hypothetical protein [Sphingobium sp.]